MKALPQPEPIGDRVVDAVIAFMFGLFPVFITTYYLVPRDPIDNVLGALGRVPKDILYALVGVTARLFDDDISSAVINLYSFFSSIVGAVLIAYFWYGFNTITSATDMLGIILMGGLGGTAVLLLVMSYRMTEHSNLAPFSYFGIPLSFVLGWFFFNEVPWNTLFPGGLLIAAAGLLIIWRERSQGKTNSYR